MKVETAKDSLCLNQLITQKHDTFIIEDTCIVPDIKPDILDIVSSSGIVCIYKKEIMDGKIKIDGCINAYIMYLAEGENTNVRSLNTSLDFSKVIEIERAKENMTLDTNISLRQIECKVLNGRKISVGAMLDLDVKIFSNETVEYVKEINGLKDIQCLNKNFSINSLLGSGSTKVYAKDTLMIDNIDNLAEIMKTDLKIVNKESKISYNKVLIKSDLQVKLLYLTEDSRINMVEGTIPVVGFIDMPNVTENHICDVKYEIKNLVVKPNSVEEHSIYVEAEIEVYCDTYENKDIEMIQDLYSPSSNLSFTKKRIKAMQKKQSKQDILNIREKQVIEEIGGGKIYDVEVSPVISNQTILNDRILYEGEVELNFIYTSTSRGGINTAQVTVPFTFNMDFEGAKQESVVDTIVEISMQDFVVMPDESIDIKVDLTFTAIMTKDSSINIIDTIEESDEIRNSNNYSMIIYFVKPGDTLWKIAKKFGSTVEAIAKVNNIENVDNLQVSRQLFIPRYH